MALQDDAKPKAVAWEPSTLPRCKDYRPAHTVAYPNVGANCKVFQPTPDDTKNAATAEVEAKLEAEKPGPAAAPPTLVQRGNRVLPVHPAGPAPDRPGGHYEPWLPDSLPACADLRPAIRVPYPMVGATCVDRPVPKEVKPSEEAVEEKKEEKKEAKKAEAKDAEAKKEAAAPAKKEAAKAPAKEAAKEEAKKAE